MVVERVSVDLALVTVTTSASSAIVFATVFSSPSIESDFFTVVFVVFVATALARPPEEALVTIRSLLVKSGVEDFFTSDNNWPASLPRVFEGFGGEFKLIGRFRVDLWRVADEEFWWLWWWLFAARANWCKLCGRTDSIESILRKSNEFLANRVVFLLLLLAPSALIALLFSVDVGWFGVCAGFVTLSCSFEIFFSLLKLKSIRSMCCSFFFLLIL